MARQILLSCIHVGGRIVGNGTRCMVDDDGDGDGDGVRVVLINRAYIDPVYALLINATTMTITNTNK